MRSPTSRTAQHLASAAWKVPYAWQALKRKPLGFKPSPSPVGEKGILGPLHTEGDQTLEKDYTHWDYTATPSWVPRARTAGSAFCAFGTFCALLGLPKGCRGAELPIVRWHPRVRV